MRIFIVEDHMLLAQSLRVALSAESHDVVVAPLTDPDAVLDAARDAQPDIVLLDLDLGGAIGDGRTLVEPLAQLGGHVIVVTGATDRPRLAECVEAGAAGFVSKADGFDALMSAVRSAASERALLSDAQRFELMAELRSRRADDQQRLAAFNALTPREQEVLVALMEGKSAETIATESFVSEATVRSQVRAILRKLGVNSQLAAVAAARRAGWWPEKA